MSILRQVSDMLTGKEEGQTLVEYGLIISLIALTAVGGMAVLGGEVEGLYGLFEEVAEWLSGGGGT